jgi:glutaredoxin
MLTGHFDAGQTGRIVPPSQFAPEYPGKPDSMPSTRSSFNARYVVALLAVLVFAGAPPAYGQSAADRNGADPVRMYVFKSATCPHCQEQKPFTDALAEANSRVTVDYYEIMRTDAHHDLLRKLARAYDVKPGSVPMVFVGDRVWVGDSPEIRREIRQQVERCLETGCPDPVAFADAAAGGAELAEEDARIDLPLLGTVDLSVQPLLLSTSIIAFVDGFNPCSLWLLTILIALVLHSGSRKRVLIVGLVFLVTTAAVYGLFMVGVFSVLAYAQYLPWMYWIVAAFALLFGLVNVKDYFWFGKGLSFTIDDKYKPGIFKNFRELMTNGRSPLALAGATTVMALGIALIELPCTAGFPVIWSGLVSSHEVGATAFAGLLLVYLAIYLLDELVVFFVAVAKLRIERFQEGQARVLKLIGGVVMIALALVLVTEPEIMSQPGPAIGVFVAAFAVTGLIVLVHRRVLPRLGIRVGD